MKKLLAMILALCLCPCVLALAEEMPELEVTASFEGVGIEVPHSAIGFQIPTSFIQQDISAEEASKGVLLNAASPDMSYTLQVTLTSGDYDAMREQLQATEGIAHIQDYMVNGVNYLSYVVGETQVGVVFLGENCDEALAFAFTIPEGVNAGQIPLEIMGSLYEL